MEISSRSRSSSGSGETAPTPFAPFIARSSKPEPEFISALRGGRVRAQTQLDRLPGECSVRTSTAKVAPVGTQSRAMKQATLAAGKTVDRAPIDRREKSSDGGSGRSSGREPTTARSHSGSLDDVWSTAARPSAQTAKTRKPKFITRGPVPSDIAPPGIQAESREQRRLLSLLSRTDSEKLNDLFADVRKLLAGDILSPGTPAFEQTRAMADAPVLVGNFAAEHTDAVVKVVDKWLTKYPSATDKQIFKQIMGGLIGGKDRQKIRSLVADLPDNYCKAAALPAIALNSKLGIKYDESDLIDRTHWTTREKGKAAYKTAAVAHIHGSIVGGALCPALKRGLASHPRASHVVDTIEATMSGGGAGPATAKVDEKTRREWHAAFTTFANLVIARGSDLCKP